MPASRAALAVFIVACVACSDSPDSVKGPAPDRSQSGLDTLLPPPAPDAPPVSWAAADRADPGPRPSDRAGRRTAVERAPVDIEIDAVEIVAGAVYLRGAVPQDPSRLITGPVRDARLHVLGDRPGLATPAFEGRLPDRPLLYVRLPGEAPPKAMEVLWTQAANLDGDPGQTQRLRLVGIDTAPRFARLSGRAHRSMARWFEQYGALPGGIAPFWAFASGRILAMDPSETRPPSARKLGTLDLFDADIDPRAQGQLYGETGARAVAGPSAEPDRDVKSVPPIPTIGHPWETLLADQPKPPALPPVARFAPVEWWSMHLTDLGPGMALWRDVEAISGVAFDLLNPQHDVRGALGRQLDRMGLDRAAIDALGAARPAVLTGSDPHIGEAVDLTLVVRGPSDALGAALDAALDRLAPGSKRVAEGDVIRRVAADGEVLQLRAVEGDITVVSNSAAALTRALAAGDGRDPVVDDPGFRWARGATTVEGAAGGVFLYAGFALRARLDSPARRIATARRNRALARLRGVTYAAEFHGWLTGTHGDPSTAAGRAAMAASGVLAEADLRHDDGTAITVNADGRACSPYWGCADAPRRLIDVTVTTVSPGEAGGYGRLVERFEADGRAALAPLSVAIARVDGAVKGTARLGPLPRFSAYDAIFDALGEVRIAGRSPLPGIALSAALAPEGGLRGTANSGLREATGRRSTGIEWLGSHVTIGLADRGPLWNAVQALVELPGRMGRRQWRDGTARNAAIDTLPLYVVAPIGNVPELLSTLRDVRDIAEGVGVADWTDAGLYRGHRVVEVREKAEPGATTRIGLWHTIADGTWVAALDRAVFEMAVDAVLDDQMPAPATDGGGHGAAVHLQPAVADGGLVKGLAGALEFAALARIRAARRAFGARWTGATPPAAAADRARVERRRAGRTVAGPHGRYPTRGDGGRVDHAVYGSEVEPAYPDLPVADGPLGRLLTGLDALSAELVLEGEGLDRSLVGRLTWRRR